MRRRQPQSVPLLWLFTDERVEDEALLRAITRLPRASGIVFRHYGLPLVQRRALFCRIRTVARKRHLIVLVAGASMGLRGDGIHLSASDGPFRAYRNRPGLRSASAHNAVEIAAANRQKVDVVFLSPVFPTRSHPGGRTLGPLRFAALARLSRSPVIALGGMNPTRFLHLQSLGAYGWAGIDAFT